MLIGMIVVVCTACLLSGSLCRLFPRSSSLPYLPCMLYALGGVYFLMLGGMVSGEARSQLRTWAIVMMIAAFGSFGVSAWLQAKENLG